MALPADRETMLEEIARKHADRFQKWEDQTWEEGLALFGKAKPQERLQWYLDQTEKADLGYVLDTDYRDKRKQGIVGPLKAEIKFAVYQAQAKEFAQLEQMAEAEGIPLPPEIEAKRPQPPPMMWVQLMGMSGRFMAKVQSDFRQLLNEQAKREGLVEPRQAPAIAAPVEAGY